MVEFPLLISWASLRRLWENFPPQISGSNLMCWGAMWTNEIQLELPRFSWSLCRCLFLVLEFHCLLPCVYKQIPSVTRSLNRKETTIAGKHANFSRQLCMTKCETKLPAADNEVTFSPHTFFSFFFFFFKLFFSSFTQTGKTESKSLFCVCGARWGIHPLDKWGIQTVDRRQWSNTSLQLFVPLMSLSRAPSNGLLRRLKDKGVYCGSLSFI